MQDNPEKSGKKGHHNISERIKENTKRNYSKFKHKQKNTETVNQ